MALGNQISLRDESKFAMNDGDHRPLWRDTKGCVDDAALSQTELEFVL